MTKPARTATGPNGPSPLPDEATVSRWKDEARTWFAALRDRICAAFEAIEDDCPGPYALGADTPGRFAFKPWSRADHTGAPGGGG